MGLPHKIGWANIALLFLPKLCVLRGLDICYISETFNQLNF